MRVNILLLCVQVSCSYRYAYKPIARIYACKYLAHVLRGFDPALCLVRRRRLPVVMVRLKMSETLTEATTYIEQGHVRVGPHAVTDAAVSAFFSQFE